MEEIKSALECGICQEVATLPVKGVCCLNAKSLPPGCLHCVRKFYQLNTKTELRDLTLRSWTGCGCNINLRLKGCHNYYKHCFELDTIRNIIGPSYCYHEECRKKFNTTAELRRHLNGTATYNDKHGNCQEAFVQCQFCNYFNKRKIVENQHYNEEHLTIFCRLCKIQFKSNQIIQHYNKHKLEMIQLKDSINELGLFIAD